MVAEAVILEPVWPANSRLSAKNREFYVKISVPEMQER
jgi:hypothetical protein